MEKQDSILKKIEENHVESSKLLQQLLEECANLLKDGRIKFRIEREI